MSVAELEQPASVSLNQTTPSIARPTVRPSIAASTSASNTGSAMEQTVIEAKAVSVFYGQHEAIKSVSISMRRNSVVAFIGPSGCGKSTFLRSINRLNDLIPGCRFSGELKIDGQDIYDSHVDLVALRRRVGLVFQKPNPFPKSIYENISYGPRLQGIRGRRQLDEIVEDCLRKGALWEEVKDRLHTSALSLSGGQQQRLCIARALATRPRSTADGRTPPVPWTPSPPVKIEDLIHQLKSSYTIVIVHPQHAASRPA